MKFNGKIMDWNTLELVDAPKRMTDFLNEIEQVCFKYQLSISHQDGYGAFILEDYKDHNLDWLYHAKINF